MPPQAPPPDSETFRMDPVLETLPAGTELWRCHQTRYPGGEFSPVQADVHFGGSRFDGTPLDPYPYLYAAPEQATALAEVLLRAVPFDGSTGTRLIPHARVAGRSLTALRTAVDLRLIRLVTEEDLAAICQDSWLLETEGPGYAQTRRWATALRARVPHAQGLLWQSRRHRPKRALVLFGDRCGTEPVKTDPGGSFPLDTPQGMAAANRLLAPLRAVLVPRTAVEVAAP
ncbi:RES family NAD+ phosphorylase [Streptomyces sp. FH025]|uniref:RES family NAD+ phosphorylase n=1 Tax=Streptomyces sp. FH025 TaxID=2815937 RepID=UPI001A9EDEF7|nr:RES family NAD+ phosphorylase [Streptomyces sp. FH025]MBO1416196.1 RES family NAD+ phosphorylase [Streptomyces sp. FH025]